MTSDWSTTAARLRERIAFGRDFHRLGPHHLAETGEFDPHQAADRFRSDVAFSNAGPAGGEDQSAALRGEGADRGLQLLDFIRDDRFAEDIPVVFQGRFQGGSAEVVVFALAGAIER